MLATKRVKLIAIGMLLLLANTRLQAQDPAGAATLGAALALDLNKAQDLIRNAEEAGNDLLLTAAMQLQNTILDAQIAYEASLSKTKSAVDDSIRKAWTDIDNVTDKLAREGAAGVSESLSQLQIIADILPLSRQFPLLRKVTPLFAVPGDTHAFTVRFEGNFPFTFSKRHMPELEVGTERVKAVNVDTLSLVFDMGVTRKSRISRLPKKPGLRRCLPDHEPQI